MEGGQGSRYHPLSLDREAAERDNITSIYLFYYLYGIEAA